MIALLKENKMTKEDCKDCPYLYPLDHAVCGFWGVKCSEVEGCDVRHETLEEE
jgi:hypothetical protein